MIDPDMPWQVNVAVWMADCFGPEIASDKLERCHRFIEEALELTQSAGMSREDAHKLVDYVYGRPVGEIESEVGGTMTTLTALCLAFNLDLADCASNELTKCWLNIDKIREKQKTKPKGPLPL